MSSGNITLCCPRQSSGQNPNALVVVTSPRPQPVLPSHVLLKVDRFGFSANNITYQVLGEHPHFRYFDFHPVPESDNWSTSPTTHGLTPVWGFGTIIASTHPKIKEGERVYGYLAPTRYLLLPVAADVNRFTFYIPRPHLPADRRPYNQFIRCETDPHYIPTPIAEDLTMLYRPLFWTAYWCEDWLHSSSYRNGASVVLISSASAKTAFCLAYLIGKRIKHGEISEKTKIIGLTSPRNINFTERLGLYHQVLGYNMLNSLQASSGLRWIYIDIAGNNELNQRISAHFTSPYTPKLVACIALGLTNLSPSSADISKGWAKNTFSTDAISDAVQDMTSPSWPSVEHFFMPEWLEIRRLHMATQDIFQRQNKVWKELMEDCTGWVKLKRVSGPAAVKEAYVELLKEGLEPDKGFIWSLWDEDLFKCELQHSKL